MTGVGTKIQKKYHWVPLSLLSFFLFLKNAGGHGTGIVVEKYVKMLKERHKIIYMHQCQHFPATDMLDLRVWMALQNVVENYISASKWSLTPGATLSRGLKN